MTWVKLEGITPSDLSCPQRTDSICSQTCEVSSILKVRDSVRGVVTVPWGQMKNILEVI